jgi:hypothetical protein
VSDPSGTPLPSVAVSVAMLDGSYEQNTFTNLQGRFKFGFLKPGVYALKASMDGFQTQTLTDLIISVGETRKANLTLQLSSLTETIVVEAKMPMIEKESQELNDQLDLADIEKLPTTRDVNDLINFTPGASTSGVYGGSGSQANSYTMDGVSVNSTGYGGSFLLPNVNWIQSFQVKGLGAGAEYGNFQGGLINIVTKSGSNSFQGSVHAIYETADWNDTNLTYTDTGAESDAFQEFNADLSGAFIPNRFYYFFSIEQQREDFNVVDNLQSLNNEDVTFFQAQEERTETKLYGKLTFQASPEDRINLVFGVDDVETENRGLDSFSTLNATETQESPSILYNLSWERNFASNGFLEIKWTGYDGEDNRNAKFGEEVAGVQVLGGDRNLGRNAPYTRLRDLSNNTFSATFDGFYFLGLTTHHLKVGGDYNVGTWLEQRLRNGNLTWRPEVDDELIGQFEDPSSWGFISSDWGGGIRLDAETVNASFFIQDYISLNERIDLSLGLRYGKWEGNITPGFSQGPQFTALSDDAIAPRAGITVDLFNDEQWIVKAHYGKYYQSMFALLYDRVLGADAFQDEEYWDWIGDGLPDLDGSYNEGNRDQYFELYDTSPTSEEVGRVENYSQPYVEQIVLSLEHQLTDQWMMGLTYINRENKDILALVDKNLDSNYVALHDVEVVNYRTGEAELDQFGNPLFLDTIYIRSENYDPDYVLTVAPEAERSLDQWQWVTEAFGDHWSLDASVVYSDLKGNFYSVSGYDDPAGTGAGAYVFKNQQTRYFGRLQNQPEWVTKIRYTQDLPMGFRFGLYYLFETGTYVTPSYLIDTRNDDFYDSNGDWIDYSLFTDVDGEEIFLDDRGAVQLDDFSRLDFRFEKTFSLSKGDLRLTLDAYNLLNEDAATQIETLVNGQDLNNPTTLFGATRRVQNPRAFQFRASFRW